MPRERALADDQPPLIGVDDLETPEWARTLLATSEAGVLAIARSLPGTVRTLIGWAWRAAPAACVALGLIALVSGVVTASGVLATADVFAGLLADGPTPERVLAALPALAVVAALFAAAGALDAVEGGLTAVLVPRVEKAAQDDLYRAVVAADLVAFDDADFTALVRQGDRALLRISDGIRLIGDVLAGVVTVAAAIVAAGLVQPLLAPAVLLAAAPQAWAAVVRIRLDFGHHIQMISAMRRRDVTGGLILDRESAAEIRAVTARDRLLAEHQRIVEGITVESVRVSLRQNTVTTLGRAAGGVGAALAYVLLGLLLYVGGLALPLAGAAVVALRTASSSLVGTVSRANFLFETGLHTEVFRRCVAEARARARAVPPEPTQAPTGPAVVTLSGVTFRYPGAEDAAVRDVDLVMRRGETVALVGENGSGKSTLAKLLVGLYLPAEGTVAWDGRSTASLPEDGVYGRIALVEQDPVRWPTTAENNVRVGRLDRRDDGDAAFRDAVARSGTDAVLEDLPSGRATVLSREFQGGRDLSGGQWQRIAVARGLYRDAALVVADEPTAALDARAEHAVFASLRELGAGGDRITVLVTHRLANVRTADRIVVLEHGRVAQQGTHDELMAAGGTYAELFTLQGAAYR